MNHAFVMLSGIVNTAPNNGGMDCNAIQASILYQKGKGVSLFLTVVDKPPAGGLTEFRWEPIGAPKQYTLLLPQARQNKKQEAALWDEVQTALKAKTGRVWDEVTKFAAAHKLPL